MIDIKGLYKSFDDKTVLSDINATFENGKTNLIIGQSRSCMSFCSFRMLSSGLSS